MITQIVLQARDDNNHISFSMRFNYSNLAEVQRALEQIIPTLLIHGIAFHENLEFPLTLNGVQIEQITTKANKNKNVSTT